MFGYISPDRPYLFIKDETLYKALYCGVCRSISSECGQLSRTALTYDIAFMSALVHNIRGEDVKIVKRRCPVHPLRSRPMTEKDEITSVLACANTALAYFKLSDDKADKDARGALRFLYNGGYKKVVKKHPRITEIVSEQMRSQAELEHATEHTDALMYAIGKWVYLIDALDDYDKDVKKGRYNVLYLNYGEKTLQAAVNKGKKELFFIFDSLFADMRQHLSAIKFHFNHDLTDNIILRGIPLKTRQVMFGWSENGRTGKKHEEVQS